MATSPPTTTSFATLPANVWPDWLIFEPIESPRLMVTAVPAGTAILRATVADSGLIPKTIIDDVHVALNDKFGPAADALTNVGSFRRYRVLELVNFITTELHKRFSFLFNPDATKDTKDLVVRDLEKKLDYVDGVLGDGPFLMGDELTLPDPYLFVMTGWAEKMLGGLDRWPNLRAFRERMLRRPSVRHVLRFEGLLEEEPAG